MEKLKEESLFPMELGRVPKNKKEVIMVSIGEYGGKRYIDIRTHLIAGNGDTLPTKKGITLNLRTFEPVAKLMLDAYKALKEIQDHSMSENSEETQEE